MMIMKKNTMNDINPEQTIPCFECQAGQMRSRLVTYITWIGDDMITVPDFPAWTCDVCGRSEYDQKALQRLKLILNPEARSNANAVSKRIRKDDSGGDSRPSMVK